MKFGVYLPQSGPAATRDGVLAVARTAEDAGLDSVWAADHIVHPVAGLERYPYGEAPGFRSEDGLIEPLTALSVVAGASSRVRLGTSSLIVPMRHPLVTAKTIATLDVLSGGRTTLAVGAGWWKDEFEALGARFERRYAQLDEQIEILRHLWTRGRLEVDGEFYSFDDLYCEPRPIQVGGPPIWVAGKGQLVMKRAARYGTCWHTFAVEPDDIPAGRETIAEEARRVGRSATEISTSTVIGLSSDLDKTTDLALRFALEGVSYILVFPGTGITEEQCDAVERFVEIAVPTIERGLPTTSS